MRDDFPQFVKETLAKRVNYLCSNPTCPIATIGPHTEASKAVNKGVAAHITAASPGGKRYDSDLTQEQRSGIENGIWLCQNCAKLIDSDDLLYTTLLLREWKAATEKRVQLSIESNSPLIDLSDHPDLRIRASYAGGKYCSHVHLSIFNASSKPIYLSSWFRTNEDRSSTVSLACVNGSLPFRLQDQDHYSVLIDVGKEKLKDITSLGIIDGNNRSWPVNEQEIARIRQEYLRYKSLKPDSDTSEIIEKLKNCNVHITALIKSYIPNFKQLEVHFRNDSDMPIQLTGAEIEWKYDPHRELPNAGGPKVAQIGGNVSLKPLFETRTPVLPSSTVCFALESNLASVLVELLFDDVKDQDIKVVIYTTTKLAWTAYMDEIPEAIREFARYIADQEL